MSAAPDLSVVDEQSLAPEDGTRRTRKRPNPIPLEASDRQQIVDEFAIVSADPGPWKGQFEAVSATGIDLVQHEGGPELRRGPDEQSGAGGGFEHGVGRAELCRHAHRPGDRGRGGELLEGELVFGAHRLCRQPTAQIDQSVQPDRGAGDVHARTGRPQPEHLREFERIVQAQGAQGGLVVMDAILSAVIWLRQDMVYEAAVRALKA